MLRTKSLTYSTARYIISTISTATARTNGVNRTLQLYVELLGPEAHDELESLKYYLQTEECQEWEPARSCNLSISISCVNNYSLREPYHPFSFFFLLKNKFVKGTRSPALRRLSGRYPFGRSIWSNATSMRQTTAGL